MDEHELRLWLNIDEAVNVQMPNEIFDDLAKEKFASFNHKCFAYAFYYLVSYLYRNANYGRSNVGEYGQQNLINLFISNKTMVSYITKKNGLLDSIGYTKTTNNYPTAFYMDNDILEFSYNADLKKNIPHLSTKNTPRFIVKEPIKALVRFDGEDFTGTFYSFQNTHKISKNKFAKIISDSQLGHVGLFIYGYLSMMTDKFRQGYQISNTDFANIVGCSDRTITKYTNRLEEIGLITSERKVVGNKLLEKIYSMK